MPNSLQLFAVLIILIQAAAIAALLIQRTRRARAERPLRESEAFFRRLADEAPLIMWTTTEQPTLRYLNRFCSEFSGAPMAELVGDGWLKVVHPDDVNHCINTYVPAITSRRPFLMEYRLRRSDGVYRWVLANGVPKYDSAGNYAGHIGCSVDITERRESEDALAASEREIHHFAGRLIEARDAERARIARDLHDDVSQQLADLSIAFSGITEDLGALPIGAAMEDTLRSFQHRTRAIVQSVRHLSHDLHPAALRHAGLVASLVAHCAELQRAHGTILSCSPEGNVDDLSPEASLCLYRIAQESLRNVIAHAGASRADIRVICSGGHAELTIVDDGKGFNVGGCDGQVKGLGLVSMMERAKLAGGTVSVESAAARGTRVCARIPIHAAATH
jgi:PAS domain S-box-containing protein